MYSKVKLREFGHAPEKIPVDRRVPRLNADKAEPQHLRLLRARRERQAAALPSSVMNSRRFV